jgi:hypothetical protein
MTKMKYNEVMKYMNENQKKKKKKKRQKTAKLDPLFTQGGTKILYRKGKKIGLDYYFVEIKTDKGVFSINLDNLEKSDHKYTINMPLIEG